MAEPENLELLNEAIGLTLSDVEKEVYVGSYRCDLVANDETTETFGACHSYESITFL